MATTSSIDKIKALRTFSGTLRGAVSRWATKYADRKHYDKQRFGFTADNDRSTNAFRVPATAFEAYVGTYGNSSVGREWSVDQALVTHYFRTALNTHKQAIFDTMADLADADAEELLAAARKELANLQTLLGEAA